MKHFFRASNADPARILQQTVCYDRKRSLTVSIAWGYSVQVFKDNVLLPDLLAVQKTFVPWKRGRNVTDVYMFNTKHVPRDECKRGALFFLKSISSGEGKTETTYNRQPPRKCSHDLIPLRNLSLIKVTAEQLQLVPGKVWVGVTFGINGCLNCIPYANIYNSYYLSVFSGLETTLLWHRTFFIWYHHGY